MAATCASNRPRTALALSPDGKVLASPVQVVDRWVTVARSGRLRPAETAWGRLAAFTLLLAGATAGRSEDGHRHTEGDRGRSSPPPSRHRTPPATYYDTALTGTSAPAKPRRKLNVCRSRS